MTVDDDDDDAGELEEARPVPLEELRAMMDDPGKAPTGNQYFDEEAEMSEDGGHEDDYKGDKDDEDLGVVKDLIGTGGPETETQEKRRAQLHAQWNEELDKREEAEAMHALEHGYRGKRGRDEDENMGMDELRRHANRRANAMGENYDAQLRNAVQDMLPKLAFGVSATEDRYERTIRPAQRLRFRT